MVWSVRMILHGSFLSNVWNFVLSPKTWRQTMMEEAIMNMKGYHHNHPQHRQRTKTLNHPHNLFRVIWFAFEIDFDFNFDQEQMGLPPPLSLTVSLFLRFSVTFFLLITHTHTHAHSKSAFTQQTMTAHTHAHAHTRAHTRAHTNQVESPKTLWHLQRGLT